MNFKTRNRLVLGITGGILCGKSTALKAFASCGAYTLSCDDLVREISSRPEVRKQIASLTGAADKKTVAEKIFASPSLRRKLEHLLHPLVAREIAARLKKDKSPVCAVEVPLLFEAGWREAFDLTLCVCARRATLPARLKARGMKKTDFLKRSAAQYDLSQKAALADMCLFNDASAGEMECRIKSIYRAFTIYQSK